MPDEYLSVDLIKQNTVTRVIGRNVIYLPVTTSTNEVARQAARERATEGTVVIAGQQTAGRGRLGRNWSSPPGSLALSVILRPQTSRLSSLIMIASLAVVHAIEKVTGLKSQIKWPNDILINNKKVCGILIENAWKGSGLDYSVIGIGLNVNFNPADYEEVANIATSLSMELGRPVSVLKVIRTVLMELDIYYSVNDVFTEWKKRLTTLGKDVKIVSGKTMVTGIAESVGLDGSLDVRCPDGVLLRITVGDVTFKS